MNTWQDVVKEVEAGAKRYGVSVSAKVDPDGRGVTGVYKRTDGEPVQGFVIAMNPNFAGCKVTLNGEARGALNNRGFFRQPDLQGEVVEFSVREPN